MRTGTPIQKSLGVQENREKMVYFMNCMHLDSFFGYCVQLYIKLLDTDEAVSTLAHFTFKKSFSLL